MSVRGVNVGLLQSGAVVGRRPVFSHISHKAVLRQAVTTAGSRQTRRHTQAHTGTHRHTSLKSLVARPHALITINNHARPDGHSIYRLWTDRSDTFDAQQDDVREAAKSKKKRFPHRISPQRRLSPTTPMSPPHVDARRRTR